uniref:Mitochondrial import inner membrane translocase subunit n=1 Tax=Octopus bimaculoides TaxID=37653 RepID=A0A0L8G8Y6_OCTBM
MGRVCVCVDKTRQKLDSHTELCIASCTECFLDMADFVFNQLESVQEIAQPKMN